ncbi:MAG: PAS domain S-box protein [Leptospirillia bacterium]
MNEDPKTEELRRREKDALRKNSDLFLTFAQDGIHILDAEGFVTEVSDSFCRMLGYSREEMEGMHLSAWEAGHSGEGLELELRTTMGTPSGETRRFETLHRKKDQTVFPVEITATPFRLGDNLYSFNASRDISARVARESENTSLREDLEGTLEALPDLLFELDGDGRFVNFHAGPESLLYLPPSAFIGKLLSEVLPPDVADLGLRLIRETDQNGSATGAYDIPLPGGAHHFEVRAIRKKSKGASSPRYLLLSRDVTERVNATRRLEALLRTNAFLAQANLRLSTLSDEATLFREVCSLALEKGGLALAALFKGDPENGILLRAGDSVHPDLLPLLLEIPALAPQTSPREIQTFSVAREILEDPSSVPWQALKEIGIESLALFPLTKEGAPFGALLLGDLPPDAFPPERTTVLGELARDLSRALDRIDAQRRESHLFAVQEAIFQSTLSGIALLRDRKIVQANERLATMLGYDSVEELLGQPTRIVYYDDEEYERAGSLIYPHIFTGPEVQISNLRAKMKNGTLLWLDTSTIHIKVGEEAILLVTLHDVTERHQQAERLLRLSAFNALLARAAEILSTANEEGELLKNLCALALEGTGVSLAWIGTPGKDKNFQFHAISGDASILRDFGPISSLADSPQGQGPAARSWRTGVPHYEGDFSREAATGSGPRPAWIEASKHHKIRSVAALPLFRNSLLWGVLALYHCTQDLFDADLRVVLEELSRSISRGLDRMDLLLRERTLGQLQKTLLDTTSAGIVLLRDRRITYANPRFLSILGYDSPEPLIGESTRILYPDDEEYRRVGEAYRELERSGTCSLYEVRARRADGGTVYCDLSAGLLPEEGAREAGALIVTAYDVTWRRQQTKRLERISSFRDLLARINQTIASAEKEEDIFQKVCDQVKASGEFSLVYIGAPDEAGIVHYLGMAGRTDFLQGPEISLAPDHASGRGAMAEAYRTGTPLFNVDIRARAASTPWEARLREFGFLGVAALPLRRSGRIFGIFTLFQDSPEAFDPDLRELLSEMASHLSQGLDRLDIRREKTLLADAVSAVGEGILMLTPDRRVFFSNEAASRLLDIPREKIVGDVFPPAFGTETPSKTHRKILRALDREDPFEGEVEIEKKNGHSRWVLLGITPIRESTGAIHHFICVLRDISTLIDLTKKLEHDAMHDALTGLPNRRALDAFLERTLARADRTRTPVAVAMIDLDDFKPVNDTFGHPAGDALLREISKRFLLSLRAEDLLVRIGGDEFTVVLDLRSDAPPEEQIATFANRLHRAVEAPFEVEPEHRAYVGMSMGVALFPRDGETSDALLRQADAALYQAKSRKASRNRWWQFGKNLPPVREIEIDDLYGKAAQRLLAAHQESLTTVARNFVRSFYAHLGEIPENREVLDTLSPQERAHLEETQGDHLLHLLSSTTTLEDLRVRAERAGEVHALCGVDTARILQAENLYATLLTARLPKIISSPSERHGLLRIAEGRLRTDIEIQLRMQSTVVEAYLGALFLFSPPPDIAGFDLLRLFQTTLETLPGIRGTLLTRPDSSGSYQSEAGPALSQSPFNKDIHDLLAQIGPGTHGNERVIVAFETREIATLPSTHALTNRALRDLLEKNEIRSALHVPLLDMQGHPTAVLTLLGAYPHQFESRWTKLFAQGIGARLSRIANIDEILEPGIDEATARIYRTEIFSGGLAVFYQPVMDLSTGRTDKVEALVRLVLTDGTVISPGFFLPLLGRPEQDRLFRIVLDRALDFLHSIGKTGRTLSVSVNIPPETLKNPECPLWVSEALARADVPPGQLTLEILENEKILHPDQFTAIRTLSRIGIRLSMDDLGSGYSSLERLSTLPFDIIKIDQKLLLRIRQTPAEVLGLVSTLLQLGRELSLEVVVEGLEDLGMVEAMAILGAPLGQGYALGRPMPPEKALIHLAAPAVPRTHSRIETWLGALACHWKMMRDYTNHRKKIPPAASCPLTAFLAKSAPEASEAEKWHREFHSRGEKRKKASAALIEWLSMRVVEEGKKEGSGEGAPKNA